MRALVLVFGAWLASLATVRAQEAEPKAGPALNWTRQPGAESCIASVELAARIEARVKKRIFVAAPQAIVAVEGYVAPQPGGGFRASISMSDGQGVLYGSRELTTEGACSELDDALVFVIAVTLRPASGGATGIALPESVASALDALFGAEPTEPDPAAFPSAPPEPAQPPPAREPERAVDEAPGEPEDDDAASDRRVLFLEPFGLGRLGLQPVGSLGGGLGVRVYLGGAGSLALRGALLATTDRSIDDRGRTSRAEFGGQLVTLAYCTPALLKGGVLALEACAAASFGAIEATGIGFEDNERHTSFFGAAGLAPRLAIAATDTLIIAIAAGPELHLARPVFEYASQRDGPVDLFTASLVGAAAELSVAFALF